MADTDWEKMQSLYHQALQRSSDERSTFLANACAGDHELQREIESLLCAAEKGTQVVEKVVGHAAAELVANPQGSTLSGQVLGHYHVGPLIGAGGMGQVYRAHDCKLGRDVALKALPTEFALNAEWLARFRREARTLASLNHPNIGAIYGLEEFREATFLVLELVKGETLQELLKRGPIPVEEAFPIAKEIAEALEAAHEKGIVHRDLKPANITITPDGKVKVLDFGLAKMYESDATADDLSHSPTLLTDPSGSRVILGTVSYMSPEQSRGRPVTKQTDIWAFGCLLFEMLTGRMAFSGETALETIAKILKEEPEWPALSVVAPPGLRQIVQRCLYKDTRRRFHDIGDVRYELEEPLTALLEWSTATEAVDVSAAPARSRGVSARPLSPNRVQFLLSPPPNAGFMSLVAFYPFQIAVSPNGKHLAFTAAVGNTQGSSIWIRPMDALDARRLEGTEFALYPFWSPDSRSIAFFAGGKLKKIDIDGGTPQVVCDAPVSLGEGGTWSNDGTIVFARPGSALYRVSASGGDPIAFTSLDLREGRLLYERWPQFLPDGRHFLFQGGPPDTIYVGSLDSNDVKPLLNADTRALYASGHLLFQRQSILFAQAFDLGRLELKGDPIPVVEGLAVGVGARSAFSAIDEGILAYRTGNLGDTELRWMNRNGKLLGTVASSGLHLNPALSADGLRIAVGKIDRTKQTYDIWLFELARNISSRFTFDPGNEWLPVWSPDGKSIAFTMDRGTSKHDIYRKLSNNAGGDELILTTDYSKYVTDWTADGKYLIYGESTDNGFDLGYVPVALDRKPISYLKTKFNERNGHVSPDGRWMAYESDESGRYEIYVRSFPNVQGGKWQISRDGGSDARWRRDGKELFFFSDENNLIAVQVQTTESAISIGKTQTLFQISRTTNHMNYSVAPDGQRFLVNTVPENASTVGITVVLNWQAQLKK